LLAYEREMLKRELMAVDRHIFEQRARMKEMKIRLGIKGDDEDFINQKVCTSWLRPGFLGTFANPSQPQKRRPTDVPVVQRAPGLRLPMRPDGRSMDADLISLSDKLAEKENELRSDVENKILNHRKWNHNYIDLTRDPLSPVMEQGMELSFRPAKTQYLMTPPASVSSDSMDLDEESAAQALPPQRDAAAFQFRAGGGKERPSNRQPAFRRRIGRLNRLWIDRRGMVSPPGSDNDEPSDRWKYDHDDDDEPMAYDVDPYDTRALRFRTTIPLSPFLFSQQRRPVAAEVLTNGHSVQAAAVAGSRPPLPQPPQATAAQLQAAS